MPGLSPKVVLGVQVCVDFNWHISVVFCLLFYTTCAACIELRI